MLELTRMMIDDDAVAADVHIRCMVSDKQQCGGPLFPGYRKEFRNFYYTYTGYLVGQAYSSWRLGGAQVCRWSEAFGNEKTSLTRTDSQTRKWAEALISLALSGVTTTLYVHMSGSRSWESLRDVVQSTDVVWPK